MILHGSETDSGFSADGFQAGPTNSAASGTTYEVRVQRELDRSQAHVEDIVGQTEEFFCGRFIRSHSSTSVCWSIHWINLSLGTRIRVPIFMCGNPFERTNSYADALEIPRTSPTSGAVKVRGRS